MPYDKPGPGKRQKRPEIVPQQSKARGRYFAVRVFEEGIAPIGCIAFRGSKEDCEKFVANGCKRIKKKEQSDVTPLTV